MKRVGSFEAKTHLAQLLDEVWRTRKGIIIQRRGQDVAALVPCEGVSVGLTARHKAVLERLRAIRQSQALTSGMMRELIDDGRER